MKEEKLESTLFEINHKLMRLELILEKIVPGCITERHLSGDLYPEELNMDEEHDSGYRKNRIKEYKNRPPISVFQTEEYINKWKDLNLT